MSYVKDSKKNPDGTYTVSLVNMLPTGELIESVVDDYPAFPDEEDEQSLTGPLPGSVVGPEGYGNWNLEFLVNGDGDMKKFYQTMKQRYGKSALDVAASNPSSGDSPSGLESMAQGYDPRRGIRNFWTVENGKRVLQSSNVGR
jgi:hypothetical protein